MMSCPSLNRIYNTAFWQQVKEFTNFVNVQMHAFVITRGEFKSSQQREQNKKLPVKNTTTLKFG